MDHFLNIIIYSALSRSDIASLNKQRFAWSNNKTMILRILKITALRSSSSSSVKAANCTVR